MNIFPIDGIQIKRVEGSWPFPADLVGKVDAHWQAAVEKNPHLWNGRVLGTVAPGFPGGLSVEDGILFGDAIEASFAEFLTWRDHGAPEIGIRNLFGSALVMSSDGAMIYGVMADWTANAGKIYPPGGSLEPSDVDPWGNVLVAASISRELKEETGLDAADARLGNLYCAFDGPRVSIGRVFHFPQTADELVTQVMANLETQDERELARVVAVTRRNGGLVNPALVPYARLFAEELCR